MRTAHPRRPTTSVRTPSTARPTVTEFNGGLTYIEAHEGRVPVVVAARVGRITGLFHPRQKAHLDVYLENTTPWVSYCGLYTFYPMALLAVAGGGGAPPPARRPCSRCWRRSLSVIVTVALFYAATRFRATAEGRALPAGRGRRRCRAGRRSWRARGSDAGRDRPASRRAVDRPWPASDRSASAGWRVGRRTSSGAAGPAGCWCWPCWSASALRLGWILYAARSRPGLHDPLFYLAPGPEPGAGRRLPLPTARDRPPTTRSGTRPSWPPGSGSCSTRRSRTTGSRRRSA